LVPASQGVDIPYFSRVYLGEKNLVYKNQEWELIHQKYKANESTSKHNPKKKKKLTIN
jgi:hypothetical protein